MSYSFKSVDKKNGKLLIDSKGKNSGYIFVGISSPAQKRYKLRITKDNDMATYDLNNKGKFEMFSFQYGSGVYRILLYENIVDNKYGIVGSIDLNVKLKNQNISFLVPNQYVNYHQVPELTSLMTKLCYKKTKDQSLDIVKTYINNNFTYDFEKAKAVTKGMLPDLKGLLKTRKGICFDIAALATAMLRIIGIPAKLVIGYADNQYHAWVEIIESNKVILYDPTFEIYNNKIKNYIPERYY